MPRQLRHPVLDMPDLRKHVAGGFNQQSSCGSGNHPATGANEQDSSEPVFDLAQLMADGRLGDVQPVGGASNAFRAGNLGDQPQVPRIEEGGHEQS